MNVALMPDDHLAAAIRQTFAASNALETAICNIRVARTPDALEMERALELINMTLERTITDLVTERNFRECKKAVAA